MAEAPLRRPLRVGLPGSPEGEYPVVVGRGSWTELPDLLRTHCPAHRYALITDERVRDLHASALAERLGETGLRIDVFDFPEGEASKTREMWSRLSDELLTAGLGRDAAVLAVGGGVVGDLAGFVAATFMRGIPYVQVPTTLLAMVDSSVGGKTGVDTPAGKNLIGAFHAPRAVIADVNVLATLQPRDRRAGLAEAVKHGAIADAEHFQWLESLRDALRDGDAALLEQVVTRSVEIKAGTVARDEREAGPRKMLNFGHTIGHAVEALSGYEILHGEAVSIGLVAEARLGEDLGITAAGTARRIAELLRAVGLPTSIPHGYDAARVVQLTRADKKTRSGQVEYSLIEQIGRAAAGPERRWSVAVPDSAVMAVLRGG